jgi:hypothetical protein
MCFKYYPVATHAHSSCVTLWLQCYVRGLAAEEAAASDARINYIDRTTSVQGQCHSFNGT